MNYVPQVGEEFMVRSYDDLEKEYGYRSESRIYVGGSNTFLKSSRGICGIPFICEEIVEDEGYRDKDGARIYRVRNKEMRKMLYSGQSEITTTMIEPVTKIAASIVEDTNDFLM